MLRSLSRDALPFKDADPAVRIQSQSERVWDRTGGESRYRHVTVTSALSDWCELSRCASPIGQTEPARVIPLL